MRDPIEDILRVKVNEATDSQLELLVVAYEAARADPRKFKEKIEADVEADEEKPRFVKPKRQSKIAKILEDI